MGLTGKQRHEDILAEILEFGQVEVKRLAQKFGVSDATIRRDLRALADERQIDLSYGGATLPRPSDFSFRSKAVRNVEAKRLIGRLAAEMVGDNEQICVDSGTTCFELCRHLKRRRGLLVIANSVRVAVELGAMPEIRVLMLGGQYRPDRMDFIGPLATGTIEHLRGYLVFMGADGLSKDFGVSASDIESAHLYRQVIRNARETILLVDHGKFLTPSLFKICELADISRIVTDQVPPADWVDFLNLQGVELNCPEKARGAAGSVAGSALNEES